MNQMIDKMMNPINHRKKIRPTANPVPTPDPNSHDDLREVPAAYSAQLSELLDTPDTIQMNMSAVKIQMSQVIFRQRRGFMLYSFRTGTTTVASYTMGTSRPFD